MLLILNRNSATTLRNIICYRKSCPNKLIYKRKSIFTREFFRNNIQIEGYTEDALPLEPLKEKYLAFNWNVIEVDGHNIQAIINAVNEARKVDDRPTVIIARTIAGKGVSFMEGKSEWHAKAPNKDEFFKAMKELKNS